MMQRLLQRLCAVALACAAALPVTYAAPMPVIDEKLSTECTKGSKGPVEKPVSSAKIDHQYMLLLVFKKGTGKKYFGNPSTGQYGCIPDAAGSHDASGMLQTSPTGTQLMVATCPNDCSFPFQTHELMNDGADPLGTNAWGVASAIASAPLNGGPGRNIEVWEIPVFDACHARVLYKFHTDTRESLLSQAYAAGDMDGEILVGYQNGKQRTASLPCP